MKKIFIDAGHGGKDLGASAYGLEEKELTLSIALLLRTELNKNYVGHQIRLSRSKDETVTLKERTNMANKWGANLLLSIHINAGGGTGFESYIYNGNYRNKGRTSMLQKQIHNEIVVSTAFRDRGRKMANFHMLRKSTMPAILTENGFIDHKKDNRQLKSDVYLRKIAEGHAVGLALALGLKQQEGDQNKDQITHLIKAGDTFWSLAKTYNTTVEKLLQLNKGINPHLLQIGQQIRIK